MEYVVRLDTAGLDLGRIGRSLQEIDPAAVADIDPLDRTLRVSATMLDRELLEALAQAGHPVGSAQVERMPSICCGGCSG